MLSEQPGLTTQVVKLVVEDSPGYPDWSTSHSPDAWCFSLCINTRARHYETQGVFCLVKGGTHAGICGPSLLGESRGTGDGYFYATGCVAHAAAGPAEQGRNMGVFAQPFKYILRFSDN